ncbi:MAG: hypothetical protein AAF702_24545 [Chloroflexota bacterium]
MNLQKETTIQLTFKGWHFFVMGMLVTLIMFGGVSACYQGRDISRWTGRAQRVELPDDLTSYDKIITVSFHKNESGETLKDVTYIGADGLMRSKEYKDWGLLEGEIIWELTAEPR